MCHIQNVVFVYTEYNARWERYNVYKEVPLYMWAIFWRFLNGTTHFKVSHVLRISWEIIIAVKFVCAIILRFTCFKNTNTRCFNDIKCKVWFHAFFTSNMLAGLNCSNYHGTSSHLKISACNVSTFFSFTLFNDWLWYYMLNFHLVTEKFNLNVADGSKLRLSMTTNLGAPIAVSDFVEVVTTFHKGNFYINVEYESTVAKPELKVVTPLVIPNTNI